MSRFSHLAILVIVVVSAAAVSLWIFKEADTPPTPEVPDLLGEEPYEGCSSCDARHQHLQRNRNSESE